MELHKTAIRVKLKQNVNSAGGIDAYSLEQIRVKLKQNVNYDFDYEISDYQFNQSKTKVECK